VSKNAEAQVRIFIKDSPLGFRIRAEILGDEARIGACLFGLLAHQLATRWAGVLQ